jgi:hypothetical protein
MRKNWGWTGKGLAAVIAAVLLGAPQFAVARQRCDDDGYSRRDTQNSRYRENRGDYRNSGYGYDRYRNSGYDQYRNSSYNDSGYYNNGYGYGDYPATRSAGQSAAIIGGSAAAGAVVGGLSGGKKGAIIGAAVGGVGGLIYDRTTRNDQRRW